MLLVDDPPGDVAVQDGQGEVERLGTEPEMEVDLQEEVEEVAPHVPLKLGLLIHSGRRGHGEFLFRKST